MSRHSDPTLCVVLPDQAIRYRGHWYMDARTVTGLVQHFQDWDAPVVVVAEPADADAVPGPTWAQVAGLGPQCRFVTSREPGRVIAEESPDLWTALLMPRYLPLLEARLPGRCVLNAENDLANRLRYSLEGVRSPLRRARIAAGARRHERGLRRAVRRSDGLQCNGGAAFAAYGGLQPRSMMFYDSRVFRESRAQGPRPLTGTLSLAFSGRLIQQKGFADALAAFAEARRRGLDAVLHVFGDGDLRGMLPDDDPRVEYHGLVSYEPDWVRFMTEKVDALLIPHRQGDPSCTYLEGMGCALPFVSYDNDTAQHLVTVSQAGWTAPLGDVRGLAEHLLRLQDDPGVLVAAQKAALAFAAQHTFEAECARRAAHLRSCGQDR